MIRYPTNVHYGLLVASLILIASCTNAPKNDDALVLSSVRADTASEQTLKAVIGKRLSKEFFKSTNLPYSASILSYADEETICVAAYIVTIKYIVLFALSETPKTPLYTIKDVLLLPKDDQHELVTRDCLVNGKPDRYVVAYVKKTNKEYFDVIQTWRIVNGSITSIKTDGITCVNYYNGI